MSMFLVAVKMCSLNVDHYKSNNLVCGFRIPPPPRPESEVIPTAIPGSREPTGGGMRTVMGAIAQDGPRWC